MITCPNCRTIYQQPTNQCSECGRFLTQDTNAGALNMQLMTQVGAANDMSRVENEIRGSRRTNVVGSSVGIPHARVERARGSVHKLFEV